VPSNRAPDSRAQNSRAQDSRAPEINADFVPDLLASLGIVMPAGAVQAKAKAKAEANLQRAPADVAPSAAGQFLAASFGNETGTRCYKLYIPSGYHGQALPLVVLLHGCKQHPDDFAAGTRFNDIAEQTPCLVLYPAQAPSANVSACWNWFSADDQQRGCGEPAILAGITEQVIARYHVDLAQVYVAGLSAGAAMALITGRAYPDLYAAIGIHSGLPVGAAHDLPTALAAMKRGAAASTQRSTQYLAQKNSDTQHSVT
jgi:poly(hydroxyalkanoate) depolymerase family esterase